MGVYRGVYRRTSGTWMARVNVRGVSYRVSGYERDDEAALAYDRLALHVLGSEAPRNFPLANVLPADVATLRREVAERIRSRKSSAYFGVWWSAQSQRWTASIVVDERVVHIGSFGEEREAAEAYDRVAKKLRGPDAELNFPENALLTPATPEEIKEARRAARKACAASRYRGVAAIRGGERWAATIKVHGHSQSIGLYDDEDSAAIAYDRAARRLHGRKASLNFPERRTAPADVETLRREAHELRKATTSSRYRGVSRSARNGRWHASTWIRDECVFIASFDDEGDAARCYDRAAKGLRKANAQLNFPGHPRLPPATIDELRREASIAAKSRTSSRYHGVRWIEAAQKWGAKANVNGRVHSLGYHEDEETAARAHDRVVRYFAGSRGRINFPDEHGAATPMEVRRENRAIFKETTTSQYRGVSWSRRMEAWLVQVRLENDRQNLGYFDDEYEAALAYDRAAARLHGAAAILNFPARRRRSQR